MIDPRLLKGFRDYLPDIMIQKKGLINNLENIFENYGFSPINTPALEYSDILLGKSGGETEKQIYRFLDQGKRDIALRFDLTVPLARFVSLHFDKLTFPFKCYHIGPVWRGENTQKGRFREFYQCDFDILGTNSIESGLEILLIIKSGLTNLNIGDFKININNRKIINALLNKMNLTDKSGDILRTIDKIHKIGFDNVLKDIVDNLKVDLKTAEKLMDFLNINNSNNKILGEISDYNEIYNTMNKLKNNIEKECWQIIDDTEYIFSAFEAIGIKKYFSYNPAITRGLDYYTGIVFESFIIDQLDFGSICSGGRYDNLTGLYSKNIISGIGGSFGLDRILALMENKNIQNTKTSKTDLLILNLDIKNNYNYHLLAENLRSNDIKTEIFFDKKKIAVQFKYAEKKSINFILFAGEDEFKKKRFNIKNIKTGEENTSLGIEEIIKIINKNKMAEINRQK